MFEKEYKKLVKETKELEKNFDDPAVVSQHDKMKDISKRYNELKETISLIEKYQNLEISIKENEKIISQDNELKQLAEEENKEKKAKAEKLAQEIQEIISPQDPNDKRNAIMEIRAGAGGDEASLFAADLFRMYTHYSENKGFKVEILSLNNNEIGGYKEIIAQISGKDVYKILKFESGVHRVQRIPTTEKSGRIHTSTVTVAIMPEAEEVEVSIEPKDLKIDVYRSSGPGGQSVNTTDSAVRITHIPSGTIVTCQDQKSQHKNKEKALKILKTRILAHEKEKQLKESGELRSSQVGSGDRSEKIRTYNYPQNRITDHRIPKTWHNLDKAIEGELDDIIQSLQKHSKKED